MPTPPPDRCVIETLAPHHRYLQLDEPPVGDCKYVTVSAWAQPVNTRGAGWQGRTNVSIGAGPFRMTLSPSVAQLRSLALLLTATADDQEMLDAGVHPLHQADQTLADADQAALATRRLQSEGLM